MGTETLLILILLAIVDCASAMGIPFPVAAVNTRLVVSRQSRPPPTVQHQHVAQHSSFGARHLQLVRAVGP